jgi:cytoskeleton protein RodZ
MMPLVRESLPPSRAGADLKAARERLGLSLQDMARTLRIRLAYLEALEDGRIAELPGTAYALAFVRSYANALGLDAEVMIRRCKSEAAEFGCRTELVFPVPMAERGVPAGAVLLLGVVLAIGAYTGWYRLSAEGRLPAETVTAIPERLASLAEQALPPSPTPKIREAAAVVPRPIPAVAADTATADMLADAAPPVMSISPTSAAAAQLPPRATEGAGGLVGPGAADASRIVLRATADAWLMVKDSRGGATLLNRTMKAGETWPVPVRPDLVMTTGNAGGTEVVVDGVTMPGLGASGAVRRDLPLDPDQIKDGRLASAAMPQPAGTRVRQ